MFKDFTETWKGFSKEKVKPITMLLVVLNVVLLLISNIIAARAFEFGFVDGIRFALPIAVILYPAVITISDVLAECDWKWTRRSCHIGFALNILMCIAFEIANAVSSEFAILHNTWYLLIASLISFYVGDLVNDRVFLKHKNKDGEKSLIKRCMLSTLLGQLLDSSIFIILGMHVLPILFGEVSLMSSFGKNYIITSLADPIGWLNVAIMIALQISVKLLYELILAPFIKYIIKLYKKEDLNQQIETVNIESENSNIAE